MKDNALLDELGSIDPKYVTEAQQAGRNPRRSPKALRRIIAAAACLTLCAAGAAGFARMARSINPITPETSDTSAFTWEQRVYRAPEENTPASTTQAIETQGIPHWEDMTDPARYTCLTLGDSGAEFRTADSEIDPANVGALLGTAVASGQDVYDNDAIKTAEVSVYAINGIRQDCGVAAVFPDSEGYWFYITTEYAPATLGQFTDDLNLTEGLELDFVATTLLDETAYHIIYFENAADSLTLLTDLMLSNAGSENQRLTGFGDYGETLLSFSVTSPAFGNGYERTLWLTDKGFLCSNILEYGSAFEVGEDAVNRIYEAVKSTYTAYEYVYTQDTATEAATNAVPETVPAETTSGPFTGEE